MKEALAQRKERKARKPRFIKQDARKKAKLSTAWRKPRGLQSKMRLEKKGYARSVTPGWGSPLAVHGLSKEGLLPVRVATLKELEALDVKSQGAVLGATVGAKKKELLLQKAKELKITVLNLDIEKTLAAIGEDSAARKKRRDTRDAKVAAKKKTKLEEKAKEPLETKAEPTEEKDADAEKEALEAEKQKVLTKRQ